MAWASGSAPLDDFGVESASDESPVHGEGLSISSKKRIYGVLCLASSASGKRTPGRQRVLQTYRVRLGISRADAEIAEDLAGHMKSIRVGRRQPEQDAVMAALVDLLTADGKPPTSREQQLLERIGKRASWSARKIGDLVQARLRAPASSSERRLRAAPVPSPSDSATCELFDASAPAGVPVRGRDDPFGASLQAPALGDEDLFGASLQAPALTSSSRKPAEREPAASASDPFGASLQVPALATPRDPFASASDPFANLTFGEDPFAGDPREGNPFASAASDPFANAPDPFAKASDPFANAPDPFADDPLAPPARPERSLAAPLGLDTSHSLGGLDLGRALGSDLGHADGFVLAEDDEDSDTGIIRDPSLQAPRVRRRRGA